MLVVLVVLVLIVVVVVVVVEESVWRLRSAPSLADSPLMSSSSAAAAAASAMGLVRDQLLVVPLVLVCASTLAGNIRIFIH